jgi:hypothetical protein
LRTAYKVWSGIAAGVFCIVAVTDLANSTTTPTRTTNATSAATTSASPTATSQLAAPSAGSASTAVAAATSTQGDCKVDLAVGGVSRLT